MVGDLIGGPFRAKIVRVWTSAGRRLAPALVQYLYAKKID
jgi:hypothetical protein